MVSCMKVIFLDINGVLDTHEDVNICDAGNLMRLKSVIEQTNAKVVITSSLKNSLFREGGIGYRLNYWLECLREVGIEVIGYTPKGKSREEEITLYLMSHPEIDSFCIIDDDYALEKFKDNLVKLPMQINPENKGFEEKYMQKAIEILEHKNLKR